MKRRQFIAGIGSAAAWPLAARAQQGLPMSRVAMLFPYEHTDAEYQARVQALRDELTRLGWTPGRNIQFDVRWTTDNMDMVRANAADIVAQQPAVIVSVGARVIPVFMQLTRSIPIVVAGGGDLIAQGFAPRLARPDGNVTGFSGSEVSIVGKQLEALKRAAPNVSRVAIMFNPDNPTAKLFVQAFEEGAGLLGVEPMVVPVHGLLDIEHAVENLARSPGGGILFPPDITILLLRDQVTALAASRKVPAIYSNRVTAVGGGLMSYDTDVMDIFRRAAGYVDRILRGEKPGDLPIQQPPRYLLSINLKTAKALDLAIPETLLAIADKVIE